MAKPAISDEQTAEQLEAASTAAQSRTGAAFDSWLGGNSDPIAPAAAPYAQPQAAPPQAADPLANIEPQTREVMDTYDKRLRADLDQHLATRQQENDATRERDLAWSEFQDSYPHYSNMDEFISPSFAAITNGSNRMPPTRELRAELFRRVAEHADARYEEMRTARDGFKEPNEGEDTRDTNRTAGVSGKSAPGSQVTMVPETTDKKDEGVDPESTLLSELVEFQGKMGNGAFFPPISHEDAIAEYGKSAISKRAASGQSEIG